MKYENFRKEDCLVANSREQTRKLNEKFIQFSTNKALRSDRNSVKYGFILEYYVHCVHMYLVSIYTGCPKV